MFIIKLKICICRVVDYVHCSHMVWENSTTLVYAVIFWWIKKVIYWNYNFCLLYIYSRWSWGFLDNCWVVQVKSQCSWFFSFYFSSQLDWLFGFNGPRILSKLLRNFYRNRLSFLYFFFDISIYNKFWLFLQNKLWLCADWRS